MRARSVIRAALAALALCLCAPAEAQVAQFQAQAITACGSVTGLRVGEFFPLFMDTTGNLCTPSGGGSGGGASTVTGSQEQDVTDSRTLDAASTASQQVYPLNGQATFSFNFKNLAASGATVSFFQSNDYGASSPSAATYTPVSEVNTGNGSASLTRSIDGQSAIGVEGTKAIKVQVTTAGTGTITLATNISVRSRYTALRSPVNQGAAGTVPWLMAEPDGQNVALGAKADAACATDAGTCTLIALVKRENGLLSASTPAGTNDIGYTRQNGLTKTGTQQQVGVDSRGALIPPNAGAANRQITKCSIAATSATLTCTINNGASVSSPAGICPAVSDVATTEVLSTVAAVGLGLNGQTLTTATLGTAAGSPDLPLPNANTLYTMPVGATNPITAYNPSASAAITTCIQTLRQ